MTVLDNSLQLITAYAPTAVADNWQSSTWFDEGAVIDMGAGEDCIVLIQVTASATTGAGATVRFVLQGDTTSAFGAPTDIESAPLAAIAAASLTAGTVYSVKVRRGLPFRYYRIVVRIAVGVLTAGTFNAWLTADTGIQDTRTYPANYTVL